jgi:hypothetical protein
MDAPPKGPGEVEFLPQNPRTQTSSAGGGLPPEFLAAAVNLLFPAGGAATLDVAGNSMIPTLRNGDAVRIALGAGRRRVGDLLVFMQAGSVVVHRYLGRASDPTGRPCLRTRGDGQGNLDPALLSENVLGRVVAIRRGGTWFTLEGAGARAYAAALALHDLFWAACAHLARRAGSESAAVLIGRLDAWLLLRADAVFFSIGHGRLPAPAGPEPPESR